MEKTVLPSALDYVAVWAKSWKLIVFVPLIVILGGAAIAYIIPTPPPVAVAYADMEVAPEERAFFTSESNIAEALASGGLDQSDASGVSAALNLSSANADGVSRASLSWADPEFARTALEAVVTYFNDNSSSLRRSRESMDASVESASTNLEALKGAVDYLKVAVDSLPPANELAWRPDNLASVERATNLISEYVNLQDKVTSSQRRLLDIENAAASLGIVAPVQVMTEQSAVARLGKLAAVMLAGLLSLFLCLVFVSLRNALEVNKGR